jgi:hypothetical protein
VLENLTTPNVQEKGLRDDTLAVEQRAGIFQGNGEWRTNEPE